MITKNMAVLDENNIVVDIIICNADEPENEKLIAYTDENPAYINGDYFEGKFYPEKPYPSWIRGEVIVGHRTPIDPIYAPGWVPPVGFHQNREELEGKEYIWNESIQNWELV